LKFQTRY